MEPEDMRKVIVIYAPRGEPCASKMTELSDCIFHLQNPKSGEMSCFTLMNGYLQEVQAYKRTPSSWFIGNHVCADGSLLLSTPMDPLFVLLPHLDAARMKKDESGSDSRSIDLHEGYFQSLEQILFIPNSPSYFHLLPLFQTCVELICDVKVINSTSYYRLQEKKVLAWLLCKLKRIIKALRNSSSKFSPFDDEALKAYSIGLLGEFLPKIWFEKLCKFCKIENKNDKKSVITDEVLEKNNLDANFNGNSALTKNVSKRAKKKVASETGSKKITNFFRHK